MVEQAVANIDAQIADLTRARTLILAAAADASEPVVATGKKRGSKRRGAPTGGDAAGQETGL